VETSVRQEGKHQKTERAVKLDPACEHVSDIKKLNRENRTVRVENAIEKKINDHIITNVGIITSTAVDQWCHEN